MLNGKVTTRALFKKKCACFYTVSALIIGDDKH